MRYPPDRAAVPDRPHPLFDIARMNEQPRRQVQHLADEREILRSRLPQRGHEPVDDTVREQPPDDPSVSKHRRAIALGVAATYGQSGDQVVDHEVVQHDRARAAAQRLEDPSMPLRTAGDVADGEVDVPRWDPPLAGDADLAPPFDGPP